MAPSHYLDQSMVRSCVIHLNAWIDISSKITNLRLQPHLPGSNQLSIGSRPVVAAWPGSKCLDCYWFWCNQLQPDWNQGHHWGPYGNGPIVCGLWEAGVRTMVPQWCQATPGLRWTYYIQVWAPGAIFQVIVWGWNSTKVYFFTLGITSIYDCCRCLGTK